MKIGEWISNTLYRGMEYGYFVDLDPERMNTIVLERDYKWHGACFNLPPDTTRSCRRETYDLLAEDASLYLALKVCRSSTIIHYLSVGNKTTSRILDQFFHHEYRLDQEVWRRRVICFSIDSSISGVREVMIANKYTYITTVSGEDLYLHRIYDVLV